MDLRVLNKDHLINLMKDALAETIPLVPVKDDIQLLNSLSFQEADMIVKLYRETPAEELITVKLGYQDTPKNLS